MFGMLQITTQIGYNCNAARGKKYCPRYDIPLKIPTHEYLLRISRDKAHFFKKELLLLKLDDVSALPVSKAVLLVS